MQPMELKIKALNSGIKTWAHAFLMCILMHNFCQCSLYKSAWTQIGEIVSLFNEMLKKDFPYFYTDRQHKYIIMSASFSEQTEWKTESVVAYCLSNPPFSFTNHKWGCSVFIWACTGQISQCVLTTYKAGWCSKRSHMHKIFSSKFKTNVYVLLGLTFLTPLKTHKLSIHSIVIAIILHLRPAELQLTVKRAPLA